MSSSCAYCSQPAEESLSIAHRECGHLTHVDCIEAVATAAAAKGGGAAATKKVNYKLCGKCTGEYSANTANEVGGVVVSLAHASMGGMGGTGGEPRTTDGIDYVLHPGTKKTAPSTTTASSLKALVGAWLPGGKPASAAPTQPTQPLEPLELLNRKTPIGDIVQRHHYGLDHFLRAGVTLEDFLKNGYSWQTDLTRFEDLSGRKGKRRALQALTIGLRANANHFRDYPDTFPPATVMQHVGLAAPSELCRAFGLAFPDDGPLECHGDQQWTAKDCVALGLSMEDLMDSAGLYCKQQYEDLMHGLTRREASVAEKALQTRIEHLEALVDLDQTAQQFGPPPQQQMFTNHPPPEERVVATAAPRKFATPAPPAAATFVHATPVARSVAADAAPPTRYRQQQGGRGEKFQRHGAMII